MLRRYTNMNADPDPDADGHARLGQAAHGLEALGGRRGLWFDEPGELVVGERDALIHFRADRATELCDEVGIAHDKKALGDD